MNTDTDLLRRYVHDRAEAAFTELVQRHLGLVYSVSLRRVGGDAQLAEDVTQRVFSVLARKAPSLLGRPTLSGWLYTSAHLTSAAVVRGERRRKAHETEAQLMQTIQSSSEPTVDWTRLRPVIDDIIVALKEEDREAIALRFFEKCSFAEVGLALRVTEDAARKRVDRALEKLRAMLAQRGITSTTAALGIALPAFAAIDSPAGLGGKVARHALAGAPAPSLLTTIAQAIWPAAAVLVLGGALIVTQRQTNDALRTELAAGLASESALATLRIETRQLAPSITAARALSPAALPTSVSAPAKSTAAEFTGPVITITAAGTLAWNNDFVSLAEFKYRLRELQAKGPEAAIRIQSWGRNSGPLRYVLDEARQAQIQNISEDILDGWWF
ncbi:MAG: sigma-70 family RNA polymerase sigma factor [Verrucomicrobiota bacterium]